MHACTGKGTQFSDNISRHIIASKRHVSTVFHRVKTLQIYVEVTDPRKRPVGGVGGEGGEEEEEEDRERNRDLKRRSRETGGIGALEYHDKDTKNKGRKDNEFRLKEGKFCHVRL